MCWIRMGQDRGSREGADHWWSGQRNGVPEARGAVREMVSGGEGAVREMASGGERGPQGNGVPEVRGGRPGLGLWTQEEWLCLGEGGWQADSGVTRKN